ncbi:hypothetical protein BDV09DRAFT_199084 [Aspergillus tetrazonus]
MHFHYAELSIYETIHAASPESHPPQRPSLSAGPFTAGLDRLECHWRSVDAIKSWLDVFLSLSPAAYVGFSFPFWAQMVRCIMVLYRLSIYADPLWDRSAVRRGVDLLRVLEHIANIMQQLVLKQANSPLRLILTDFSHRYQIPRMADCAPGVRPSTPAGVSVRAFSCCALGHDGGVA